MPSRRFPHWAHGHPYQGITQSTLYSLKDKGAVASRKAATKLRPVATKAMQTVGKSRVGIVLSRSWSFGMVGASALSTVPLGDVAVVAGRRVLPHGAKITKGVAFATRYVLGPLSVVSWGYTGYQVGGWYRQRPVREVRSQPMSPMPAPYVHRGVMYLP